MSSAGTRATSSWSPATPTSITRASARRWSGGCWRRRACGSGSSPARLARVEAFRALGRPTVMFGITAGNMDSMVNRYTSDRQAPPRRRLHAGRRGRPAAGPRAHRLRPALPRGVPRRARRHRRHRGEPAPHRPLRLLVGQGAALDPARSQADLLVYGNGERAVVEIAHRLAAGEAIDAIRDLRGTAFSRPGGAARRLDRDRFDDDRHAGPRRRRPAIRTRWTTRRTRRTPRARAAASAPTRCVPRASRGRAADRARRWCACPTSSGQRRRPVRARLAHPACRGESGQRARAGPAARRRATCG